MRDRVCIFFTFLSLSPWSNETDPVANCKQHDFFFYVTDDLHGLDSIEVHGPPLKTSSSMCKPFS